MLLFLFTAVVVVAVVVVAAVVFIQIWQLFLFKVFKISSTFQIFLPKKITLVK